MIFVLPLMFIHAILFISFLCFTIRAFYKFFTYYYPRDYNLVDIVLAIFFLLFTILFGLTFYNFLISVV